MNLAALHTELTTDPLALGYAKFLPGDPVHAAALLNDPRFTKIKTRFVTARTVLAEVAGGAALLDKLQSIGATQSAVKYAMTFLNQEGGIDIGNAATQGMVDQLVAGAALTAAEGTALKNLALQPASRAEVLGLGTVTANDIVGAA